jgi:hypothetical protein
MNRRLSLAYRIGLVFSRFVLAFANIHNRGFQTGPVVDEPLAATFGPPVLPKRVLAYASGWYRVLA